MSRNSFFLLIVISISSISVLGKEEMGYEVGRSVEMPPPNDVCDDAIQLFMNSGWFYTDNLNTSVDGPVPSCGGMNIDDVWFYFTYNGGHAEVWFDSETIGPGLLTIYDGCNGNEIACGGSDTFFNVVFGCNELIPGQSYFVQASGFGSNTGTFRVKVENIGTDEGCTDQSACNYWPAADCDDGSCQYIDECGVCGGAGQVGCTNILACNYDPTADCDNGSCEGQWYLPLDISTDFEPAIFGCSAPPGYYEASNQDCVQATVDNDDPCVIGDWDVFCQDAYCQCAGTGCTDPAACNYDANVSCDDGSCSGPPGCTDPAFCNYDPLAGCDDGSCLGISGCTYPTDCNYDPVASCDDGSCIGPPGCTVFGSCNYDSSAGCDDGSCIEGIPGCTDPASCIFDPWATCDDGSCEIFYGGCTDYGACNYDQFAWCDDGSCDGIKGCEDPLALNYDPNPDCGGGFCQYVDCIPGCTQWDACNYDPNAECNDGSCIIPDCFEAPEIVPNIGSVAVEMSYCHDTSFPLPEPEGSRVKWFSINPDGKNMLFTLTEGTTQPLSLKLYLFCDPSGEILCGSWPNCYYDLYYDSDVGGYVPDLTSVYWACPETGFGYPYFLLVQSEGDGTVFLEYETIGEYGCMDDSYCNYNPLALCDAENCEGQPGCNSPTACNYNPSSDCDDGSCIPSGCTDSSAFNFNPMAGCDDGSCEFHGCTYPEAENYDSAANVDNGECILPASSCPADFNGDQQINTSDLLSFLSLFGTDCNS